MNDNKKTLLEKINKLLKLEFMLIRLDFLLTILLFALVGYIFFNLPGGETKVIVQEQNSSENIGQITKNKEIIKSGNFLSVDLKKATPDGSPPRLEREYTFDFNDPNLDNADPEELAKEMLKAIKKSLNEDIWAAPKIAGNDYFVDGEVKEYFYRDVYFDTPNNISYDSNTLYRLRNRFKSKDIYEDYLKDKSKEENWPYRIEFQSKTDVREEDEGFSSVKEARFEFREESAPFSKENPPPARPWDLNEFIGYLQSGVFKNYYTWPAVALVDFLIPDYTDADRLEYEPRVFVLTQRFRGHLNIETPWGSGPNPTQAYILTLDRSEIYPPTYLDYLNEKRKKPKRLGVMMEVETEFERNVSSKLDDEMKKTMELGKSNELAYLNSARAAFFEDQKTIMKTMIDYFGKKGIAITPNKATKYRKAFDMLPKKMRE